jgi:hypothetical protein
MSDQERKISSLRDMPRDIAPPRDLWRGIEARIAAEPRGVGAGASAAAGAGAGAAKGGLRRLLGRRGKAAAEVGGADASASEWARGAGRANRLRILAAAAVIAALAVGIWIGRAVLPAPGKTGPVQIANVHAIGEPEAIPASFVMDPKYMRQRAALLQTLQAQIAALPPDSQAKVMSSLRTIHDSMRDLEAALGRDPSNALLQELLVNTYQDEMRVLTAVHEAGDASRGI